MESSIMVYRTAPVSMTSNNP